jgi:hypothetical protein
LALAFPAVAVTLGGAEGLVAVAAKADAATVRLSDTVSMPWPGTD